MSLSKPPSIVDLMRATGFARNTVMKHCRLLEQRGWAAIEGNRALRRVVPLTPDTVQRELAAIFVRDLAMAAYKGEFLMRAGLDELIDSADYVDNPRPEVLTNPETGQPLEYDRYYPRFRVAFEWNGSQHYRTTKRYPSEDALRETRKRDLIKKGLSQDSGIRLIVMTNADLSLSAMMRLIPSDMPLVTPRPGPYLVTYDEQCRLYIATQSER